MNLENISYLPSNRVVYVPDAAESARQFHPRRILIADDDETILNMMSAVLGDAGFLVDNTSDGQEAWEALVSHQDYDLLVTDNEMPRLTGTELIQRLRDAGMALPVVIVSGNLSEKSTSDFRKLQIAAEVPKPFSIFAFLDTVRDAMQASAGGSATKQRTFSLALAGMQPTRG